MDTLQAIRERRAVKNFDPDFKMPQKDIDELLELALLSPTSFNIQNWRFVNVVDKKLREELKTASMNQAHVADASLVVVICADVKSWKKDPQRYWRNTPQEAQDFLVPMIAPFYEGKKELQRDEAMRSAGIAAQTLMLAAKSMGYDSCPMIGYDPDAVAKIINLPEDHTTCMMVVIGKATKPAWPRPGSIEKSEAIITDKFN